MSKESSSEARPGGMPWEHHLLLFVHSGSEQPFSMDLTSHAGCSVWRECGCPLF